MITMESRPFPRLAQLFVVAILVAVGISHVVFAIRDWPLGDMDVYLAAARRLRDGEALYVAGDVAVNSFWYAPWYAVLWIPMTYLPREAVAIGWSAVLLAATAAVASMLWTQGGAARALAVLVAPVLFAVSAGGNIQALMVLALLAGFHRRWGPIAVAAAASMKLVPILLVVAYLARREWWKAAAAVTASALLLLPAVPMGILQSGWRSEAAPSLIGLSPVLYVVVVLAALVVSLMVPRRHALTAAAATTVLALPRWFVYDVTLVAVGAAERPSHVEDSSED